MPIRLRSVTSIVSFLSLLPPMSAAAQQTASAGTQETFRAELVLTMGQMTMAPEGAGRQSTFQGRCSRPADWMITFTMEGESAPLGRVRGWAEHCSTVVRWKGAGDQQVPDSVIYGDGRFHFITAAGDTLRGVYGNGLSGLNADMTIRFRDDFAFMGGTGRFELATGGGSETCTSFAMDKGGVMRSEGVLRLAPRAPAL